jgi:hypothetical protein
VANALTAGTGLYASSTFNGSAAVTFINNGVLSFAGGTTGLTPATATTGSITLAGTLNLANGGTQAALTAVNGGIVYSGASAMAISAAGSVGNVLLSGGAGTPTWSSTGSLQVGLATSATNVNITNVTTSSVQYVAFVSTTSGYTGIETSATSLTFIPSSGNFGIGTASPSYKLQVVGSFAATTKSFVIDHPTTPGKTLRYGSLESPYHGVRLTGKATIINGVCTIDLPGYIRDLCYDKDVNIQLTNIKHGKILWVESIDVDNNKFTVSGDGRSINKGKYDFYWSFTAIRKDIPEIIVEEDK